MKKLLIALAAVLITAASYGQGQVNFQNRVGSGGSILNAPVTIQGTQDGPGPDWSVQLLLQNANGSLTPLTPTSTFNKAGETCRKAGIQFAYHNHHFEFVPVNGVVPFDFLLKECDSNLVKMELDLCWITVAEKDPVAYFERYPGRFPLVHVKGLKKIPGGPPPVPFDQAIPNITEVGTNDVVEWKRILAKSSQAGIRHYFVEHDQPASPFDSIQTSAAYLRQLRF